MSVRNTQVYSVPVVFHDVGGEDSLASVLEALQHLDTVALQVFDRISTRVQENKRHLARIKNRVATANARVAHIQSSMSKRATRVAATAKYPGKDSLPDYESVFNGLPYAEEPIPLAADEPTQVILPAEPEQAIDNPHKSREMLHLFWNLSMQAEHQAQEEEQTGLGRFPAHMPSVANLLLFDSSQNPYKQYSTLHTQDDRDASKRDGNNNEPGLAAAPTTLTEGDHRPSAQQVDFGYKPKMKELQEFDLPEDLAMALPNIIEDQAWDGADQVESIAPSMFLPDLDIKQIADAPGNLPPPAIDNGAGSGPAASSAPPPPPPAADAPPPPPPPAAASGPPSGGAAPTPGGGAGAPPPAAAPAVPAAASDAAPAPAPAPTPAVKGVPPAIKPARMNLLESIRNAGIASLKKKKNRKVRSKKELPKRPLTMNEELKARLARKRVALGGRPATNKAPPKRKNTIAKPVMVVSAATKFKANAAKAKSAAPPPPPVVEDISEADLDDNDSVSSLSSSGEDSLPDPNAAAPPPTPVAAPAPAPPAAPAPPSDGQRRMTALGSALNRLRRDRADSVDSIDSDDDSDE